MDKETLKALRGSISKWRAIAAGRKKDQGWENCPLCIKFLHNSEDICSGCPVSAKTHSAGCRGTPYERWEELGGLTEKATTTRLVRAAKAEVRFLESLLPKQ